MGAIAAVCLLLLTSGCATPTREHRVTLSSLDRELGSRYESEPSLNGLHPMHLSEDQGRPPILWTDFCQDKECSGARMTYSQLTKEVAMATAFLRQLDFIVDQATRGTLHGPQVQPFLEYGWREMPAIADRLTELKSALQRLDPRADFSWQVNQTRAWDAIAIAAGNLEEAEARLKGLDDAVQELFRVVEPDFEPCEQVLPPTGLAFVPSPEEQRELEVIEEELAATSEEPAPVLAHVVRRGFAAIEEDRRRAEADGPLELEEIAIRGPVNERAVRSWLFPRGQALLACLPAEELGPLPLAVKVHYARSGGVEGVELVTATLPDSTTTCLERQLGGGTFRTDAGAEAGGTVEMTIVLRRITHR